jgi:hypothetical protein
LTENLLFIQSQTPKEYASKQSVSLADLQIQRNWPEKAFCSAYINQIGKLTSDLKEGLIGKIPY